MRFRSKRRQVINSSWLVRVLARSRDYIPCGDCGARMFAGSGSGLCPVCRARRKRLDDRDHTVGGELVDGGR